MSQTNGFSFLLNRSMKFMLRSPLHRMVSDTLLLITFTGRKSGKTFTTPISYSEHDGQLFAFTRAGWWRNMQGGAPVTLSMRGREVCAVAEAVEDKASVSAGLKEHLEKVPSNAKVYQVSLDSDTGPDTEDLSRAAQKVVMLRIQPC